MKNCEHCDEAFTPNRKTQKFCKSDCRRAYWRDVYFEDKFRKAEQNKQKELISK